jgi:DNA invertase Pin-like site-specific DNA recombinase
MNCAVYARKSNEQNGIADESKSVARQVERARAYAARRGWTVSDEHLYVDDGISGAVFAGRPGFVRLMNALRPKPPFQALVMSEESRLGCEQIEVSYALKQLVISGVCVFCYLTDTERTLNSPVEKAMLALQTMADKMELEKARQRSRDAALQRASHGHVTGGTVFGYRNRRDQSGHVVRDVDPTEADVVRRIFRICRDGKGRRRIAQALNRENAPGPRAQQGRPNGWVPSSVRAVLYRPLYRGEVVWGKARKRDSPASRVGRAPAGLNTQHDWQPSAD